MASMAFPDHLNLYKVGDESGPSIIAAVLVYGSTSVIQRKEEGTQEEKQRCFLQIVYTTQHS